MFVVYILIGAALLGILWVSLRAIGLPRYREKPEKILDAEIEFSEPDGLGETAAKLPNGMVRSFQDGWYQVDLLQPYRIGDREARSTRISARHSGYPISRARKTKLDLLSVNGELSTGQRFITSIRRS